MKAIELKPTDLLAVSIPKEYSGYKDFKVSSTGYVCYKLQNVWQAIPPRLMDGFYTLLGSVTAEHIDFDPAEYIETTLGKTWAKDYTTGKFIDNISHAFRSLLTANDVHFVNPYELKGAGHYENVEEYFSQQEKWLEVESKLVKKILIIKPL